METAGQIQTPAVSEFLPSEIPAQPPEPQIPEPVHPAQDEVALAAQITKLWQIHNDFKTSLRQQSQNLHSLRAELGKKLAEMKALLARPGCSGKWSSWLKEHGIARSTADRLVVKHECSLSPDSNCTTDPISEPTEAEIQNLLGKVAPKLRKALRTPTSVYRFIDLLSASLAVDHHATDEGLLIPKPAQKPELAEPVQEPQDEPAKPHVEPVPVVTDVLPEGSVESTCTVMAL